MFYLLHHKKWIFRPALVVVEEHGMIPVVKISPQSPVVKMLKAAEKSSHIYKVIQFYPEKIY